MGDEEPNISDDDMKILELIKNFKSVFNDIENPEQIENFKIVLNNIILQSSAKLSEIGIKQNVIKHLQSLKNIENIEEPKTIINVGNGNHKFWFKTNMIKISKDDENIYEFSLDEEDNNMIIERYLTGYQHDDLKNDKMLILLQALKNIKHVFENHKTGGKKSTTYILNGEKVIIIHNKNKLRRSIYVKKGGKTRYVKVDNEYILYSKCQKPK